ncbi:predicted protein [Postia placenta Mad-698-R]|nr:predicted protein [Postia placenta Mad-698-R]
MLQRGRRDNVGDESMDGADGGGGGHAKERGSGRQGVAKAEGTQDINPNEVLRQKARRAAKAERDERMDITTAMTPVKEVGVGSAYTFSRRRSHDVSSGFTRPTDLRLSNWWQGGAWRDKKRYEIPPAAAYEPHTVFLLESRYPVKHGIGRIDSIDHFVGVCREGDLPAVLARLNSPRAPGEARQAMDNARWPWAPQKKIRPVRWWEHGETPASVEEMLAKEDEEVAQRMYPQQQHSSSAAAPRPAHGLQASPARPELVATELLSKLGPSTQQRMFHFSFRASAAADAHSPPEGPGSFKARMDIPGSTWARPHKPSQDADDNVVPSYYRKEEEGGLMAELSAGILSEGVAAKTRAREEKIPVEVRDPKTGTVRHPSGFEPPTPETHFHPAAAKTPTEDHPMLATVKQLWDERPANLDAPEVPGPNLRVEQEFTERMVQQGADADADAARVLVNHARTEQGPSGTFDALSGSGSTTQAQRTNIPTSSWDTPKRAARWQQHPEDVVPTYYIERKRQRNSIAERKEEEGGLMSELNAGILGEGLAADMKHREEKIPVEVKDPETGTVRHPSGFEPPTPETHFHPAAAKTATEDHPMMSTVKVPWTEVLHLKKRRRRPWVPAAAGAVAMPHDALDFLALSRAPEPIVDEAQNEHEDEDEDANAIGAYEHADSEVQAVRRQYLPTLGAEPFWRPLLTATFSTRPLAMSFARLSRGLARGTPFYTTVSNEDRKCHSSFPTRLRNLRMKRMQELTFDLARLLRGDRGGLIGVRFDPSQRGRGYDGEGFDDLLPAEKRNVKIGVGEWYQLSAEVKERFVEGAREADLADSVEVFGLTEHGARTDGKSWRVPPSRTVVKDEQNNAVLIP